MTDFADSRRALESRDTLTGTVEIDGREFPIEVIEPTLDELEEIDEEIGENADESEAVRMMIDEYLERPAVTPSEMGVSKLFAVFEAMRECWQGGETFADAREQMPVESGKSTSRR
jgi:hypothetical protein